MTDTAPEIKEKVREQIMSRPPDERFVMGSQMFDSALVIVKASLPTNLSKSDTKGNCSNGFTAWSYRLGFKVARG